MCSAQKSKNIHGISKSILKTGKVSATWSESLFPAYERTGKYTFVDSIPVGISEGMCKVCFAAVRQRLM